MGHKEGEREGREGTDEEMNVETVEPLDVENGAEFQPAPHFVVLDLVSEARRISAPTSTGESIGKRG